MMIVKLTGSEIDMAVEFIKSVNLADYFKSQPLALAKFKALTDYDDPDKFFIDLVEQIKAQKTTQDGQEDIFLSRHQWLLTFVSMMCIKNTLLQYSGELEEKIRTKILPTIKSICNSFADGLDEKQTLQ
ncbi:hypothetical protein JW977_02670 [Candidatus Falkowbacteria bacterium]|nr:hypothetical protein [Candidatus Falkowbacteria bacterium]